MPQGGLGSVARRGTDDDGDLRRSPGLPVRRGAPPSPFARLAVLYAVLLLVGYLAGVLHHRCSGDGTSPFARWVAVVFHGHQRHPGHQGYQASNASWSASRAEAGAPAPASRPKQPLPSNITLRFPVCNGFANQRLSVLYGMVLAKRLGRAAVIPDLIDNGLQRSDTNVLASEGNKLSFGDMYDLPYFKERMELAGVRVLSSDSVPPLVSYTSVNLGGIRGDIIQALSIMYNNVRHLAVDCPLFKLRSYELRPDDSDFVWAVLDGMRPNAEAAQLLDEISRAIVGSAAAAGLPYAVPGSAASLASFSRAAVPDVTEPFNYIHLRIENDWVEHCKRWESIPDGIVRDNCYRHTDDVATQLALFGLNRSLPLYVASFWDDVEPSRGDKVMAGLAAAGYQLVTSPDVFPASTLTGRGREHRAMIEYFLGMRSQRFIGNSVSTFAALGLMERRRHGTWAAYYNGGNIPLASVMPLLHRLPWVFTYNSWSPGYDYMLKGAVRSAAATHSFQPYCLFMGNASSAIFLWLVRNNVTIISHEPKWRQQLLAMAGRKAMDNVQHSHLFKSADSLVSTFQRVDLPVMPVLDQYTYVLYTDADVYFRRPMTLDDFGLPLPQSVSMSYEMDNMFPYNAGVIVANLPTMRQQYDDFIHMMLDNDDGLYYPNYGPADQGIINKFFERDLRARMLSQLFNAKPYNPFAPSAFIVHFHGPKPHELAAYLRTGQCDFKGLCERGLLAGYCKYSAEWVHFVSDEPLAVRLNDACELLSNPVMKRLQLVSGTRRLLGSSTTPAAAARQLR